MEKIIQKGFIRYSNKGKIFHEKDWDPLNIPNPIVYEDLCDKLKTPDILSPYPVISPDPNRRTVNRHRRRSSVTSKRGSVKQSNSNLNYIDNISESSNLQIVQETTNKLSVNVNPKRMSWSQTISPNNQEILCLKYDQEGKYLACGVINGDIII